VGHGATILRSTNGLTWHSQRAQIAGDLGTPPDLHGVWGSGSDLFAVGNGTILHSNDRGGTWQVQRRALTEDLTAIWGSSPNDIFVVGSIVGEFATPLILHSSDRGTTWSRQNLPLVANEFLYAVWGCPGSVYAVGGGNGSALILHTTDGGTTWKLETVASGRELLGVWGSGPADVYTVGRGIFHSTGTGTWLAETVSVDASLEAVWGSGPADLYGVGVAFPSLTSSILHKR
jgi:hypothetical protein